MTKYRVSFEIRYEVNAYYSKFLLIQCLPDLTNRSGPSQLFVKPGNSLNPDFLCSKKMLEVKNLFVKPGWFVKTEFVKSADTVMN